MFGRESRGGDLVATEDPMENGARYAGNATATDGRVKAMEEENKIRDTLLDSRIITTSRSDAIVRFVDGSRSWQVDGFHLDDEIPMRNSAI